MSDVNIEVAELLRLKVIIKSIITKIEATKMSIIKKYNQLGGMWTDKKYKELGNTVQECTKSFDEILEVLRRSVTFISLLEQNLQEYESITFNNLLNKEQIHNVSEKESISHNSTGVRRFFSDMFNKNQNQSINDALNGVEYRMIQNSDFERSEQQIINSISGGDMTAGSCSSLAFAYTGNKAGYVIFDFRDGQSREVFASRKFIEQIANLDGVVSTIIRGADDTECVKQLVSKMIPDKQYYLATGAHAAIVRITNGIVQYLELQSGIPSENGWHSLTRSMLYTRFGCEDGQSREYGNYLIDLESLYNNSEFLHLLGYINTAESEQLRGESGHVR